jgi:hypothetical protein
MYQVKTVFEIANLNLNYTKTNWKHDYIFKTFDKKIVWTAVEDADQNHNWDACNKFLRHEFERKSANHVSPKQ